MLPIVKTLTSALGELLIKKGVGTVVDVCDGMTDAGIDKVKRLIKEKTGVDITDDETVTNLTEAEAKSINLAIKESIPEILGIQKEHRQQDLENTMDARLRHIQMANAGVRAQITVQNALAVTQIIFAMSVCTAMIFCDIPEDNQGYANTILGFILGSVWGVILNFYFGSALKDKATAAMEDTISMMGMASNGTHGKQGNTSLVKTFGQTQR